MANAVDVLRAGGILRPEITVAAAQRAGLDLASAAAMIMGETAGGRMIYGHDNVSTGGIYTKGGPVTQANYRAFRLAQQAGKIGRQGVGDAQLTSEEFISRAEQIGPGPWDPFCNQLAGFIGLADRQRRLGLQDGFRSYNGSGPAAVAYGLKRIGERNSWAARLGGSAVGGAAKPVGGSGADSIPALEEGNTGAAVAKLQAWLNRMYPAYSKIDLGPKRYGPQTRAVIAEFQRRSGIVGGDGRNIGPQTRGALWNAGYRP